jgi:hypothetical protein
MVIMRICTDLLQLNDNSVVYLDLGYGKNAPNNITIEGVCYRVVSCISKNDCPFSLQMDLNAFDATHIAYLSPELLVEEDALSCAYLKLLQGDFQSLVEDPTMSSDEKTDSSTSKVPGSDDEEPEKSEEDEPEDKGDEAPAEDAPGDDAPSAEDTPVDDAGGDEPPSDDAGGDEQPSDDTQADEAGGDEPPSDDAPADDAGGDDAPADDAGGDSPDDAGDDSSEEDEDGDSAEAVEPAEAPENIKRATLLKNLHQNYEHLNQVRESIRKLKISVAEPGLKSEIDTVMVIIDRILNQTHMIVVGDIKLTYINMRVIYKIYDKIFDEIRRIIDKVYKKHEKIQESS